MIKKFDEFNRTMNESFDWDEFNFPKVEDLLSRGYETSSETYTPIWIGVPISKSEYENEWEETDWQYDHNISFSDHVIFPNYNQSENEFDCILLRRIYGS
jgi:hypothetical protein